VLHCFLLDCSASMLRAQQLALAKGLLVALFDRAAAERAEVALLCFGNARVERRYGPAVPRWWNERWLQGVGGAGGTPLGQGVEAAARLLEHAARRKPAQQRVLWLLTDGRTTERPSRPAAADRIVVVDFEREAIPIGQCGRISSEWRAEHVRPEALHDRI
jgi:magnesium chelatase subunit ChlD-like protein